MALQKWTEERTATLVELVGSVESVTQAAVREVAEALETTTRSIAAKLRKMGYKVETVEAAAPKYTEEQEAALRDLVTSNSGSYTYGEIAEAFEGGAFSAKSIQGKLLSMELTSHIKPTPPKVTAKTYTDAEESKFLKLVDAGNTIQQIAAAMDREVPSVRGKALSLFRSGLIKAIPESEASEKAAVEDPLTALGDISNMTVAEIAEAINKTPRGVKTMLTRRGLNASDYKAKVKTEDAE